MTSTPTCKPWCDDHQHDEISECYTRFCVFQDGAEDDEESKYGPGPLGAVFQQPKEIGRIFLTVMEDEEDERPRVEIEFFETGNFTDATGWLHLDSRGLRDIHAQLGAVLKNFG
ncbi:hypothetical protein [Specibacter sp. NPDC078692]|uniref:hypothetical protein n=1 Tax=Specibacter sp. NPDC078692 TaxID=3155818 RepID=UPI00343BA32D